MRMPARRRVNKRRPSRRTGQQAARLPACRARTQQEHRPSSDQLIDASSHLSAAISRVQQRIRKYPPARLRRATASRSTADLAVAIRSRNASSARWFRRSSTAGPSSAGVIPTRSPDRRLWKVPNRLARAGARDRYKHLPTKRHPPHTSVTGPPDDGALQFSPRKVCRQLHYGANLLPIAGSPKHCAKKKVQTSSCDVIRYRSTARTLTAPHHTADTDESWLGHRDLATAHVVSGYAD